MILPIGFLKVFDRFPWANLVLIAACVLVYAAEEFAPGPWIYSMVLIPSGFTLDAPELDPSLGAEILDPRLNVWSRQPWSLFTYAFLHADIFHLAGNMLFLFVFGSAVNSELGQARHVLFFLLAAVVAGIGHLLLSNQPVIGASGAICGVTGLVAALYPRNDVRLFYFFYRGFGTVEVSAIWVVLGWFALDFLSQLLIGDAGAVAYGAHLSGSLVGFAVGVAALKAGWVESDGHDVLTWYLGVSVKRTKRPRFANPTKLHRVPAMVVPRPAQAWTPIPLAGEEPSAVRDSSQASVETNTFEWEEPEGSRRGRPAKESPAADRRSAESPPRPPANIPQRAAAERLERFFQKSPLDDARSGQVADWFRQCALADEMGSLGPKTLLASARYFARNKEARAAADAYRNLLSRAGASSAGGVALEAASALAKAGDAGAAATFLARASELSLSPEQRAKAKALARRISSGGDGSNDPSIRRE